MRNRFSFDQVDDNSTKDGEDEEELAWKDLKFKTMLIQGLQLYHRSMWTLNLQCECVPARRFREIEKQLEKTVRCDNIVRL